MGKRDELMRRNMANASARGVGSVYGMDGEFESLVNSNGDMEPGTRDGAGETPAPRSVAPESGKGSMGGQAMPPETIVEPNEPPKHQNGIGVRVNTENGKMDGLKAVQDKSAMEQPAEATATPAPATGAEEEKTTVFTVLLSPRASRYLDLRANWEGVSIASLFTRFVTEEIAREPDRSSPLAREFQKQQHSSVRRSIRIPVSLDEEIRKAAVLRYMKKNAFTCYAVEKAMAQDEEIIVD